jgi:hypothetical protein
MMIHRTLIHQIIKELGNEFFDLFRSRLNHGMKLPDTVVQIKELSQN